MAGVDVLDILRAKRISPLEDYFDRICLPYPMTFYLSPQDIEDLRKIATSVKLAGKIREKYRMIDDIMRRRGFRRFSAGTNRVVYSYLEDTSFLAKIAVDRVGMQDNPMEYKNQFFLKPYVAKMFCVSPCGTVGFAERVLPIKNVGEFKEIASDVFDILVTKFLGKFVVEDVGTKYFMNWGIRLGYSPVLLDYPYVYKLDGKKLYCTEFIPELNRICDGEIDYNSGFNHLVCSKCGKIYLAVNLRDDSDDNKKIIAKGGHSMRVQIKQGDEVIYDPIPMDDSIQRPSSPRPEAIKLEPYIANPDGSRFSINDKSPRIEGTPNIAAEIAEQSKTVDVIPVSDDKSEVDIAVDGCNNETEADIEELTTCAEEHVEEISNNEVDDTDDITSDDIQVVTPIPETKDEESVLSDIEEKYENYGRGNRRRDERGRFAPIGKSSKKNKRKGKGKSVIRMDDDEDMY